MTAQLIDKESIDGLVFPKDDVLSTPADRDTRNQQVKQAASLGNLDKQKVRIRFMDSTGHKEVQTTVWAFTDKNIVLKAGRHIPLRCVTSIDAV